MPDIPERRANTSQSLYAGIGRSSSHTCTLFQLGAPAHPPRSSYQVPLRDRQLWLRRAAFPPAHDIDRGALTFRPQPCRLPVRSLDATEQEPRLVCSHGGHSGPRHACAHARDGAWHGCNTGDAVTATARGHFDLPGPVFVRNQRGVLTGIDLMLLDAPRCRSTRVSSRCLKGCLPGVRGCVLRNGGLNGWTPT
jgi:hypothetical protein